MTMMMMMLMTTTTTMMVMTMMMMMPMMLLMMIMVMMTMPLIFSGVIPTLDGTVAAQPIGDSPPENYHNLTYTLASGGNLQKAPPIADSACVAASAAQLIGLSKAPAPMPREPLFHYHRDDKRLAEVATATLQPDHYSHPPFHEVQAHANGVPFIDHSGFIIIFHGWWPCLRATADGGRSSRG